MRREAGLVDPRDRFTSAVEAYDRYRPNYPAVLLDWVVETARLEPGDRVVDIGCGTGISSRQLAERGLDVIGLDPNDAMLAAARRANGGVRYIEGAAEELPLKASIARAAVAGQSLHWFDLEPALVEIDRVLVPGAPCFALWNVREHDTPFLRAYEQFLKNWCPLYPVASAGDTVGNILAHPAVREPRQISLPHAQRLDRDGLLGRAWSSSYVVHGVDDADGFNAALERLFDTYSENGAIEFRYESVALAFVPAMAAEPTRAQEGEA